MELNPRNLALLIHTHITHMPGARYRVYADAPTRPSHTRLRSPAASLRVDYTAEPVEVPAALAALVSNVFW